MLISTLPDLAGRAFEVRGLVYAEATLSKKANIRKAVEQLIEQARRLGADGIVDVKTAFGSQYPYIMMTGTAVKLLENRR
ncbi:heavy metal-binding domain-containing protein [Microtetraspora malaysiensis]|uniref:heavy metal-binding domain-containing protein n=1 Tax=Microtetraspora malaysiensis TaxID=161358 RepID=UPI003D8E747C